MMKILFCLCILMDFGVTAPRKVRMMMVQPEEIRRLVYTCKNILCYPIGYDYGRCTKLSCYITQLTKYPEKVLTCQADTTIMSSVCYCLKNQVPNC